MYMRILCALCFGAESRIGVPDLFDALVKGGLMLANWAGVGVIESRATAACLPGRAREVLGADLILPNIATWWCGQAAERAHVAGAMDELVVGSAFDRDVAGLTGPRFLPGSGLDAEPRGA